MTELKIIINQSGSGAFSAGANQFYSISEEESGGAKFFSVGVENVSFGLYKTEKRAKDELNALLNFICDKTDRAFRFKPDEA
jgi:hypothetical protein